MVHKWVALGLCPKCPKSIPESLKYTEQMFSMSRENVPGILEKIFVTRWPFRPVALDDMPLAVIKLDDPPTPFSQLVEEDLDQVYPAAEEDPRTLLELSRGRPFGVLIGLPLALVGCLYAVLAAQPAEASLSDPQGPTGLLVAGVHPGRTLDSFSRCSLHCSLLPG